MKNLIHTLTTNIGAVLFISVAVVFVGSIIMKICENTQEREYCGKIILLYTTPAGYKVRSEKHIVFYNDSLKRNIDIRVNNQSYVNCKVGERVCFDLNKLQLEE